MVSMDWQGESSVFSEFMKILASVIENITHYYFSFFFKASNITDMNMDLDLVSPIFIHPCRPATFCAVVPSVIFMGRYRTSSLSLLCRPTRAHLS